MRASVKKLNYEEVVPHWQSGRPGSCVYFHFCYHPSDLIVTYGIFIVYPPSGGGARRKRGFAVIKKKNGISFNRKWDLDGVRALGFVRLNT